jgi:ABC-type branched-subunit amino acid transport system substrate-binding protein
MPMSPTHTSVRVRALAALAATTLLLAACGSDDDGEPAKRGGPAQINLTIGNSVPLSGALREFGPDAKRAAELAVERISDAIEQTGADHQVELVTVDNGSDPQQAEQTARALIADDGASCIVGPWGGADTLSVARSVAVPEHVALISPAATLDELTDLTDSGLISRTAPPDTAQGPALATAIAADLGGAKGQTVNVAARDDPYGESLASAFIDAWREDGGKVGEWFTYDVDRESPGAIAEDLVAGGPDATVIFDFPASFARLAPALAQTPGYDAERTWGADLLASTELPGQVPSAAIDGLRGTLPAAPDGDPATAAFRELFAKDAGEKPGQFAEQTFDAVVLCYLAAVSAGSSEGAELGPLVPAVSSPDGQNLTWEELPEALRALESGKEIDYQGAAGPLDIDVHGDPTAVTYDIYEFSGDQILLVDQVSIGG